MIEQIETDLKTAIKAGNKHKVLVLKGLKSSLINERIALGHELTDDEIIKVVRREAKQRDEAAAIYKQGGADDKAAKELDEKSMLDEYLPQMMSEDEISDIADLVIAKIGKDPKQMGNIIGQVMAQTKGRADGRQVSEIIKSKL